MGEVDNRSEAWEAQRIAGVLVPLFKGLGDVALGFGELAGIGKSGRAKKASIYAKNIGNGLKSLSNAAGGAEVALGAARQLRPPKIQDLQVVTAYAAGYPAGVMAKTESQIDSIPSGASVAIEASSTDCATGACGHEQCSTANKAAVRSYNTLIVDQV